MDVRVWHDDQCSGGATIPPYPSGDVHGSQNGRYWFNVVLGGSSRLNISSPAPGFLSFNITVIPITITVQIPSGPSAVTLDYTISMPGYILEHGKTTPSGDSHQIAFDPVTLNNDFPGTSGTCADCHAPGAGIDG